MVGIRVLINQKSHMRTIYLFFTIVILCNSCVNYYDVNYVNNANFDIYYGGAYGGAFQCYPDTSIFTDSVRGTIQANSYIICASHEPIEDQIQRYIPSDTLSIFYFHPDTLKKYTWEEVRQGYKVLQRYDLSIEDIQKLKNKNDVPEIPYPPTEAMRNIKMYPPYGSE